MLLRLARAVHVTTLVLWATFPVLLADRPPLDLLPALAAGALGADGLEEVYIDDAGEAAELPEAFVAAHCEQSAAWYDAEECGDWALPFVSTPPALAASVALAGIDPEVATLLVRFAGVACFAVGSHLLWRRLSRAGPVPAAAMAATVVGLTPAVRLTTELGQTTPIVFLAAAVGLVAADRAGRRVAGAALLVGSVAWKLFPLAVLWVPAVERRRRYLLAVGAVGTAVVAATAVVVPIGAWQEYWTASRAFDEFARTYHDNAALDTVLAQRFDVEVGGAARALSLFVRLAAAGVLGWWGLRRAGSDPRWAWTFVAVLLVAPVLWGHYLVLVVPAVAAALRQGGAPAGRVGSARWAALPIAGAACGALAMGSAAPRLLVVAAAVVVAAWAARPDGISSPAG